MQDIWFLRERRLIKWTLWLPQLTTWKQFLGHSKVKENQNKVLEDLLSWKDGVWSSERYMYLEFVKQSAEDVNAFGKGVAPRSSKS